MKPPAAGLCNRNLLSRALPTPRSAPLAFTSRPSSAFPLSREDCPHSSTHGGGPCSGATRPPVPTGVTALSLPLRAVSVPVPVPGPPGRPLPPAGCGSLGQARMDTAGGAGQPTRRMRCGGSVTPTGAPTPRGCRGAPARPLSPRRQAHPALVVAGLPGIRHVRPVPAGSAAPPPRASPDRTTSRCGGAGEWDGPEKGACCAVSLSPENPSRVTGGGPTRTALKPLADGTGHPRSTMVPPSAPRDVRRVLFVFFLTKTLLRRERRTRARPGGGRG